MMMKKDELDQILYDYNKEITQNGGDISIVFDDNKLTATFDISDKFKEKVDSKLSDVDIDQNSIIRAQSTNKYYCYALSEPNSTVYTTLKMINAKIDKATNRYIKILDESKGQFATGWLFNYKFLVGYKYLFVIDSNPILKIERPLIIELILAPFKTNEYYMNYPIYNTSGLEGVINFNFNMDEQRLTMTSNILDKNSEITIYEGKNEVI